MADNDEELLRELHTGVAVLTHEQTAINRRIGQIEKSLEEAEAERKAATVKAADKRGEWVTWALQIIGQILLVSLLVGFGRSLGIDLMG